MTNGPRKPPTAPFFLVGKLAAFAGRPAVASCYQRYVIWGLVLFDTKNCSLLNEPSDRVRVPAILLFSTLLPLATGNVPFFIFHSCYTIFPPIAYAVESRRRRPDGA